MPYTIPLDNGESNANASQYVTLGDYSVELELHYQQSGQWLMHIIADGDVGDIPTTTVDSVDYIAIGVMLECGCDIISMYGITDLFGQLFVVGDEPDLDNLGDSNKLVWYAPDEALSWT